MFVKASSNIKVAAALDGLLGDTGPAAFGIAIAVNLPFYKKHGKERKQKKKQRKR